jgi:hypothetical protein
MWRFGVVLATLWMTGCGTVGSTKLDVPPAKFAAFEIQDERPAEQRTSSKTKEPYGEVSRLGDDAMTPAGPELLKAWLGDKIGARLSGKQIVLSEFSVQVVDPAVQINEQSFNNAMASTPGANPVSGLFARWLIGGIESLKSDKTVGVRIAGKFDGSDFVARGGGSFKGRVSEANINSVITQALEGTVKEIERLLLGPAEPPSSPALKPPAGSGG